MAADEWIWTIGNASEMDSDPRLLEAQFGGGHKQVMREGGDDDNLTLMLNVTKSVCLLPEAKEMKNFLKAKGGADSFTWTPVAPYDDEGQCSWRCKTWKFNWVGGEVMSFSAVFEQVVLP